MKYVLALLVLCGSTIVTAHSTSRKIFCEDMRYKNLVKADITRGSLVLTDVHERVLVRLQKLIVKTKKSGTQDHIRFINLENYNDLPVIVFEANVDSLGNGTAKSFDDLSGGTTNFKCGVKYLNL